MNVTYESVLLDVIRYRYLRREGFADEEGARVELSPVAEEALRQLVPRVAMDLGMSLRMAQDGLLYAASLRNQPARQTFLMMIAEIGDATIPSPMSGTASNAPLQ